MRQWSSKKSRQLREAASQGSRGPYAPHSQAYIQPQRPDPTGLGPKTVPETRSGRGFGPIMLLLNVSNVLAR